MCFINTDKVLLAYIPFETMIQRFSKRVKSRFIQLAVLSCASLFGTSAVHAQEVVVLGSTDAVIEWLQAEDWWGEEKHGAQLKVPRTMIIGISEGWRASSAKLPVAKKKEIFYRFMLPLVVHANDMVLERRATLQQYDARLKAGKNLKPAELKAVLRASEMLRIAQYVDVVAMSNPQLRELIEQILYQLDVIPPGLVLGQAAYESGYGTSRFAQEGNALFGQWTYDGDGMVPEKQREHLGNYGIASYEWPFDSVRAYYINLNSNPAYESFRELRAERRASGEAITSLELVQGLTRYSERGQAYVDALASIIRLNQLELADDAEFRDEPMSFVVGADGEAAALDLRRQIKALRADGELNEVIERMRLE